MIDKDFADIIDSINIDMSFLKVESVDYDSVMEKIIKENEDFMKSFEDSLFKIDFDGDGDRQTPRKRKARRRRNRRGGIA